MSGLVSRLLVGAGIAWMLSGCSQPESELADYRLRVLSLLRVEAVPTPTFDPMRPPLRRALMLPIPESRVGWSEFFELQSCELGALVGYRNSPLGRTAPASERLAYEVAFLEAATACAQAAGATSAEDESLRATLAPVLSAKRRGLKSVAWNAALAGPEMSHRLSSSSGGLAQLADALTDVRDALSPLLPGAENRGSHAWDAGAFNATLKRLAGGGGIAERPAAWARVAWMLNDVAQALEVGAQTVCRNGQPTPTARNLSAVLLKFFVNGARGKLTADLQTDRDWILALNRLADDFGDTEPQAFRQWRTAVSLDDSGPWRAVEAALKRHALAWQRFHDGCGLRVGAAASEQT